jgi:hypothetical protein
LSCSRTRVSSRGLYFFLPKEIKNDSPARRSSHCAHQISSTGPFYGRCQAHIQRKETEEAGRAGMGRPDRVALVSLNLGNPGEQKQLN